MPAATIRYALEHCDARAIFVGKLPSMPEGALPEGIVGLRCELSPPLPFMALEDVIASTPPLAGHPVREPDALAVIIYTSGTTGRPKGVEHTFRAMASAAHAVIAACAMRAEDRLFSYLPLAHTAERLGVAGVSYAMGAPITFSQSLEALASGLQLCKPTVMAGVPRVWMQLRDRVLAKIPHKRLKRILATPLLGPWRSGHRRARPSPLQERRRGPLRVKSADWVAEGRAGGRVRRRGERPSDFGARPWRRRARRPARRLRNLPAPPRCVGATRLGD